MPEPRILVVGDLMLDVYEFGTVERISPEAPIPVFRVERTEKRLGGAGAVAAMLAAIGSRPLVIGRVGPDLDGVTVEARLLALGEDVALPIVCHWLSTTTKTRYYASGHPLGHRRDSEDTRVEEWPIAKMSLAPPPDAVIIQDYGKGFLWPERIAEIIALCREKGIPVFVDPYRKRPADCYRGATCITPNRAEAAELWGKMCQPTSDFEAVLLTLDADGMRLITEAGFRDIPAERHEVFDVTGAGDMVIAVLTYARCKGASWEEAARLANKAAGVEVTRLGATPLTWEEIGLKEPPTWERKS